jgi:hypothetical protein
MDIALVPEHYHQQWWEINRPKMCDVCDKEEIGSVGALIQQTIRKSA